jgi:hypothetical protein
MLTLPRSEVTPQAHKTLNGVIKAVAELSRLEYQHMFSLLHCYFKNVTWEKFQNDLAEKDSVILLHDGAGMIQGFSTLMQLEHTLEGIPIVAFFSGDTIIDEAFWGSTELSKTWSRYTFARAEEIRQQRPNARVYWLLISSGYKTYRFLPAFYKEFYPTYERETPPFIKQVMDTLAGHKFAGEYNALTGIVQFKEANPLKDGIADPAERLSNPHVKFFLEINPGYSKGDELVCFTELVHDNLTSAGRRMVGLT